MWYSENNIVLIFKAAKAEEKQSCHMMIMNVTSIKSTVKKEKNSELLKNEHL